MYIPKYNLLSMLHFFRNSTKCVISLFKLYLTNYFLQPITLITIVIISGKVYLKSKQKIWEQRSKLGHLQRINVCI